MKVQDAIEGYLMDCQGRDCSARTVGWYEQKLRVWSAWMVEQGVTDIVGVTVHQLRAFLIYVQQTVIQAPEPGRPSRSAGQARTAHTVHGYAQVIKTFCTWLYNEELLEDNPARRLRLPKVPRYMIKPFTAEHLSRILNACDCRTTLGFRDYVMILLLADTGIRLAELCGLRVWDVVMRDASGHGYIRVFGKGRREREVGVSPDVLALLWKYIKAYREPGEEREEHVFINRRGEPLHPTGVGQLLRRIKRRAEITDCRVSPHTFRHTFASGYLEQGGDMHNLSLLLGHSEARTTEIYAKSYTSRQARRDQEKFSAIRTLPMELRHRTGKSKSQPGA